MIEILEGVVEWLKDNPEIGGWVGSIGTAGAFLVAMWLLSAQLGEARGRSEDERRGQAKLVGVWYERRFPSPAALSVANLYLVVRNGSSQPIYDLEVVTGWRDESEPRDTIRRAVVPPGRDKEFEVNDMVPGTNAWGLAPERLNDLVAWVAFRDDAGRDWHRKPDGSLCSGRELQVKLPIELPSERRAAGSWLRRATRRS